MSPASSFRRQAQRVSRRRRRRGLVYLAHLRRAVVLLALPAVAGWWAVSGEVFRLVDIETEGSARVDASWIERQLAAEMGGNLLLLPLDRVETLVLRHPWSASIRSRKELPGRLYIEVTDREAAAVLEVDGGRFYVDDRGHRIASALGEELSDELLELGLPSSERAVRRLDAGSEAALLRKAIDLGARLRAEVPTLGSSLRRVEILSDDDFRLFDDSLPCPILVQPSDLGAVLKAFVELVPEIVARFETVEEIDLRIAGRIIVRPGRDRPGRDRPGSVDDRRDLSKGRWNAETG